MWLTTAACYSLPLKQPKHKASHINMNQKQLAATSAQHSANVAQLGLHLLKAHRVA